MKVDRCQVELEPFQSLIKPTCSSCKPRYLHNEMQKTEIEWTKPTWSPQQAVTMKSETGRIVSDFMKLAIEEAKIGLREGGIPIGSVLVRDGRVIARGHNMRVQENDPILHAEIDCLRKAGRIGSYDGTTIYSTLMPCYLCAGAIVQFAIRKVIAGESENFTGGRRFMEEHGVEVIDLNVDECKELMRAFIKTNPKLWNEDIGKL